MAPLKKTSNVITALRKQWYEKLRANGFVDIEDSKGMLKSWTNQETREDRVPKLRRESQEEYYRLASAFVWSKKFDSPVHKIIWKLHAEGTTTPKIAQRLGMNIKTVESRIYNMQQKFYKGFNR